jgi:hypothetical protein
MWGPYLDFLYNPGYFLSMAFLAPVSAFLTPAGEVRRWIASIAAGPVSGIFFFLPLGPVLGIVTFTPFAGVRGATGFLGAGFFICAISISYLFTEPRRPPPLPNEPKPPRIPEPPRTFTGTFGVDGFAVR